jgi:hypothetical protein
LVDVSAVITFFEVDRKAPSFKVVRADREKGQQLAEEAAQ